MFVLDTNVISELMREDPSSEVVAWLAARTVRSLFVTAVTEAEVRSGIAFLPEGRCRRDLAEAVERAFDSLVAGRRAVSSDIVRLPFSHGSVQGAQGPASPDPLVGGYEDRRDPVAA